MLKNIAPSAGGGTVTRARRNRREMSLPEVLLWHELKTRPGGIKSPTQHPSGPFVLDIYCSGARLAIEIDGISHSTGDNPQRETLRNAFFARAGIDTLRIPASEVLADPVAVATSIVAFACNRLPLNQPAAPDAPPPRDKLGEDFS